MSSEKIWQPVDSPEPLEISEEAECALVWELDEDKETCLCLLTALCKPPGPLGGGCRVAEGRALAVAICEPLEDLFWCLSFLWVLSFLEDFISHFWGSGSKDLNRDSR